MIRVKAEVLLMRDHNIHFPKKTSIKKKMYLLTCAPNGDSNQPVHLNSLIKVFIACMKKLCILGNAKCTQRNEFFAELFTLLSSGAGSDQNHALLDASIKLGRNTNWYEL